MLLSLSKVKKFKLSHAITDVEQPGRLGQLHFSTLQSKIKCFTAICFDTKHFLDISPTFTSSVRDKVPGRYYDLLHLFKGPDAHHQDHLVFQVKGPTETFLWQLEGSAIITYGNGEKVFPTSKII